MSCTFWNMRRRRAAAMKAAKEAQAVQNPVKEEEKERPKRVKKKAGE